MTRLNAIIIAICVFAFLGLCVAFGSTFMAKALICVVLGGAIVAGIAVTTRNAIKYR
ncbi:hypothetical protein pETSU_162 [Edwardsiella phage pEt-SU]|uniref:Uncharacterized protein n=1 Tax=Edwardsiella phage pEt-SU TaxID=2562142 RepID=A0A4D6DWN6_9CAUD|nr:hypothetical protein HOV39_gp162 [Edwardsiella phage pEt-SU]QBZ70743.1 hypothetical protein pETSU_162 [Edwardsiella phage pEt-SU]